MNKENIKKAFDLFQDDQYQEAKDVLSAEIKQAKEDFFNNKLGLEPKNTLEKEE